jgi:hypothetical protein
MKERGLDFDLCFTSFQTRAIKTLNLALEAMGRLWLPEEKDWRLNERHYGGLTGLNKAETRRGTATSRSRSGAAPSTSRRRRWRKAAPGTSPSRPPLQAGADPADREPQGHDRPRAALLGGRIAPALKAASAC